MNEQQNLVPTFNYGCLDADTLNKVLDQETLLEAVILRSKEEIGAILLAVKELLPHGVFMEWYLSKGIKRTYANESMLIAQGKPPKLPRGGILELPEPEPEPDEPVHKDVTREDLAKRITELEQHKQELTTQVQDLLRQGATTPPTKQHHGGGGHHGLPTSTKDGVTRTMVNFDHWDTTALTIPVGFACTEIQMGVRDDMEDDRKAIVYIQNKQKQRTARLELFETDKHTLAKRFEDLARELRNHE